MLYGLWSVVLCGETVGGRNFLVWWGTGLWKAMEQRILSFQMATIATSYPVVAFRVHSLSRRLSSNALVTFMDYGWLLVGTGQRVRHGGRTQIP